MRQRSNGFLTSLGAVVALSLMAATAAMAARIVGDASSNVLTGTDQRDQIVGRGGDDTIHALAAHDLVRGGRGNDTLDGGRGCDHVFGGAGDDTIEGGPGFSFRRLRCERLHGGLGNDVSNGGPGRDFMSGGQGDDLQHGGPAADTVFANRGRDHSDGGDGPDLLWALARVDVTAIGDPEGDELTGGGGGDRFLVRDGEVDLVHCGEGHDGVLADQFDQVDNDCERVIRRDVTSLDQVEDGEENRTENPAPN